MGSSAAGNIRQGQTGQPAVEYEMTNSVQQRWSVLQLPDQWFLRKIVTELHMSRLCLQKAAAVCVCAGVFGCRAEGMSDRRLCL